jgi:hypothetical protein
MNQNANLTAEYGKTIPSLAFYHIPAHAMLRYQEDNFNRRTTPGINGEVVVSQGSGDTEYSGQDSRFMRALLDTPGLIATFSGHDHDNDWYDKNSKRRCTPLTCTGVSNGIAVLSIRILRVTVSICAMVDTLVTAAMAMLFAVAAKYSWMKHP